MYHDDYVVFGGYFRNSYYACFSTKDEDTASSNEVKKRFGQYNLLIQRAFVGTVLRLSATVFILQTMVTEIPVQFGR